MNPTWGGKVKQVWTPLSIFLALTASIMWLTGNLHFGAPGIARDREEAGDGHEGAGHGDADAAVRRKAPCSITSLAGRRQPFVFPVQSAN